MSSSDETTPCAKKTKKLLKTNVKSKKKNLFSELTFVENHVDTFYVGLNDNVQSAANPIQGKSVDIDEAVDLAKNWVCPDKQLIGKSSSKKIMSCKRFETSKSHKWKPLEFLDKNETPEKGPRTGVNKLFEETRISCQEVNENTPKQYKVYVADTPVELYDVPMHERRKRGY